MPSVSTETETVIKRILPYLRRRGYNVESDIDFETAIRSTERYSIGYVDLLVTCGSTTPQFVLEAKRNGKRLSQTDASQARTYGKALKVPFVVVTNGSIVQVYNTDTGEPLRWNGRLADKVPSRDQVKSVVSYLRRNKNASDVPLGEGDESLPFRPSLPLKQLNELFSRCHNKIRNIEKNEENAFADFSKLLFLKLLEEKADVGDFDLPYSYRFWELAERPSSQDDQIKSAILGMLTQIKALGFGDVLTEDIHLRQPSTFRYIVQELSKVSLTDSDHDVKGTAFEYFVRATLKGRKLGQYFTPRPVVEVMVDLIGREAIVSALRSGSDVRVADPACGTGGFLVYTLRACIEQLEALLARRKITRANFNDLAAKLKRDVFHGSDANEGIASAAKMNMIIAGDGHNNIRCENSVRPTASLWPMGEVRYDFILTNPPFGTAESDGLSRAEFARYPIQGGRGQHLFLQRMVLAAKPGGLICTVIDDGLLSTETAAELRRWILQNVELLLVLQLPKETFKPNKIDVHSSILLMRRREEPDIDLLHSYDITIANIESLGYYGSGEPIRGFDLAKLRRSLSGLFDSASGSPWHGEGWRAFTIRSTELSMDDGCRWDNKYWNPDVRQRLLDLIGKGGTSIAALNSIPTRRGTSPSSSLYVDESEGYAVVVKAGSCITRFGEVLLDQADWIEKSVYDEIRDEFKLKKGDVLLASTGMGTLGKAAVWDLEHDAIADSHVTVLRLDPAAVDPYYLADYLRQGFGKEQINRLYTGSTRLIELTPEHVDRIIISLDRSIEEQKRLSDTLRQLEAKFRNRIEHADSELNNARQEFALETARLSS